jgi:hypothetical protein
VLGAQSYLDEVLAYQKQHGRTPILDLRPALLRARRERQIYYATDTHWNPYGALVGYQEILLALQDDFPVLRPHGLDDYALVEDGLRSGGMGQILGQLTVLERFFHLELKESRALNTWATSGLGARNIITTARPDEPGLPRLVMYRDSFSTALVPLLADHFSRAVFLWTFAVDPAFVDAEKPDIVIIEVTERYLKSLANSLDQSGDSRNGGFIDDE